MFVVVTMTMFSRDEFIKKLAAGLFCEYNNSDSEEEVGIIMIVIVRLFYLLSLVLTFVIVIVTLLWIMHLSTSTSYSSYCNYNKLWKRLASPCPFQFR